MTESPHLAAVTASIAVVLERHANSWGPHDNRSVIATDLARRLISDDDDILNLTTMFRDPLTDAAVLRRAAAALREVVSVLLAHEEQCRAVASFVGPAISLQTDRSVADAEAILAGGLASVLTDTADSVDAQADAISPLDA